jgi:hypothetical protein
MFSALVALETPTMPGFAPRFVWPKRRLSIRISTAAMVSRVVALPCDAQRVRTSRGVGGLKQRVLPLGQTAFGDHFRDLGVLVLYGWMIGDARGATCLREASDVKTTYDARKRWRRASLARVSRQWNTAKC